MQMIELAAPQRGLSSTVKHFVLNKLAYNSGDLKSTILLMDELMFQSLKGSYERAKQAHSTVCIYIIIYI